MVTVCCVHLQLQPYSMLWRTLHHLELIPDNNHLSCLSLSSILDSTFFKFITNIVWSIISSNWRNAAIFLNQIASYLLRWLDVENFYGFLLATFALSFDQSIYEDFFFLHLLTSSWLNQRIHLLFHTCSARSYLSRFSFRVTIDFMRD